MGSQFLSHESVSRYLLLDFAQHPVEAEFCVGIDAATRAIYDAKTQISPDVALASIIEEYVGVEVNVSWFSIAGKNAALASLAREVARENTWLDGWKVLAKACPDQGLHSTLMNDVSIGVEVFQQVKVHGEPRPFIDDIIFTMVANPTPGDICQIGPKNIRGRNWENDKAFQAAAAAWNAPGDLKMGPCPFFAWIGVTKKVPQFDDIESTREFFNAQLLGIVDYDFDKDDKKMKGGIGAAIERCALMETQMKGHMRGTAWIGLLTMINRCSIDIFR